MPNYFTAEGLRKHMMELESIEERLRGIEATVSDTAESGGGWHDNAGLDHLNYDVRVLDSRLKEGRALLQHAELITYPDILDEVVIGSKVALLQDGRPETYQIVAYGDADIDRDRILYASPLASALLHRRKGDVFSVQIGSRKMNIEVLDVRPLRKDTS